MSTSCKTRRYRVHMFLNTHFVRHIEASSPEAAVAEAKALYKSDGTSPFDQRTSEPDLWDVDTGGSP